MTDLLDAVDSLSKPVHVRVVQPILRTKIQPNGRLAIDPEGNLIREVKGTQVIQVEHPPLLDQLEAAIRGEMNPGTGSSGSLASTRPILDSEALYQAVRITSMIRDWSNMVRAPRRDTASEQLRAWYPAFMQTGKSDGRFQTRVMRGWKRLIEDKLDPFDEYVHPDPCPNPECPQDIDPITGRPTWWDARARERRTDPLVIQFRRTDGPHLVERARARCRACSSVWTVRALQYELEQAGRPMTEIDEVSA